MPFSTVGFLGGPGLKSPPASAGDTGDTASVPGLGRSPGGGNGNLLRSPALQADSLPTELSGKPCVPWAHAKFHARERDTNSECLGSQKTRPHPSTSQ